MCLLKRWQAKSLLIEIDAICSMQRKLYSNILKKDVDAINGKGGERSRLLNIVMQVRNPESVDAG